METCIYLVRHGESPKTEGTESERGLTPKGIADARIVAELLKRERIDAFLSSPYRRAVLTIEEPAQTAGKDVATIEELREIAFIGGNNIYPDHELLPLVERMFADPAYAPPGGESLNDCRQRAIPVFKRLLQDYGGQRIAIGTHGVVMTLLMAHFDRRYGLDFLLTTTKPDIYRMKFIDGVLTETERIWQDAEPRA